MPALREPCAPPSIAGPADHDDFGPLAPNCRDLLRGCRKWLPAVRTDRPLSVFVDHKHTPLLLSVQRHRRMVFRARPRSGCCRAASPGAKPPCLSTVSACVVGHCPFLSSGLISPHITSRQPARIARSSGEEGQQADAQTVSWFHQLYRCQVNVSPRRSCRRIIAKLKVIVSGRSQPSDLVWAANDRRSVRQSTGAGLPIGVLSL